MLTSHRLVLPINANHHGSFYAGSILGFALESGYATAWHYAGAKANFVLRRILTLDCNRPVPIGTVAEIQGEVLFRSAAYVICGLIGTPLTDGGVPWLEALIGFAQVDQNGKLETIEAQDALLPAPDDKHWQKLEKKLVALLKLRGT